MPLKLSRIIGIMQNIPNSKNIESLSRKQPYMIIANYDQEYVDFNREESCAFDKS
jgi:hypothetical protein